MQVDKAINLVKKYLDAMIRRDVVEASQYIHPEAIIIYPGGKTFNALSTLSESSSKKFKTLDKTFDRFEALTREDGIHIVFVAGTLNGTWPDDSVFKGIRFIDRYEVDQNNIIKQEVWSDSAEFRLEKLLNK